MRLGLGLKEKKPDNLKILLAAFIVIGLLVLYIFVKKLLQKSEFNIIEKIDLSLNKEIDQNDISSYRDFIKKNQQYRKPVSKVGLLKQVKDAQRYLAAYPAGKTTEHLREKIISELNIGFLLNKLNKRELIVKVVDIQHRDGFTEHKLLFVDPQVGTFSVLLLAPNKKEKSYPAIVGLHGHSGSKESFRDVYLGKELAAAGFVVIMPSFRAIGYDEIETVISKELYRSGFTLMGLRIYETLLMIKYLSYKNVIDKIGIMGQSCGADVAYLVSIISQDLQALVYDMNPQQLNVCNEDIHCEIIPNLAYYSPQINNSATLKIPSLRFEYGGFYSQDNRRKVISFFNDKLKTRDSAYFKSGTVPIFVKKSTSQN